VGKDPETELEKASHKEKKKSVTLRELFPEFIERHGKLQSKNMQDSYHFVFNNLKRCPALVDVNISEISRKDILDYMHARMKQDCVKAATVNKDANLVKCMLSRATEWDILARNPLQGMRLFKESEKRRVNLTPKQAGQLIEELPNPISHIVEYAIYSGFRKENILGLCIEQIRFHDLTPTAEVEMVVKGGRTETFPLGDTAVDLLKKVINGRARDYVFVNPQTGTRYNNINKTFDRAVRKLGLTVKGTKLRFHDLRHVFGTWLLREGVSLDVVRELYGHRDRSTTDRYATLNRVEAGKYLSKLPRIEKFHPKKTENTLTQTDTNQSMATSQLCQ
ncbi:tyrosine-type recombinase/integrase, partial [Candidatus Latescibacterota bacterium]